MGSGSRQRVILTLKQNKEKRVAGTKNKPQETF